jgi:hypothetical protein
MKTTILIFAIGMLLLFGCNNDCPPEPLTNNDIAGYIDGSTGILFTSPEYREDVLASLDATPHEDLLYKMPVFKIDETQVYLLFEIAEVPDPAQYMGYKQEDDCYKYLFDEFRTELMDLIELNEDNLEDRFILACGDLAGKLDAEEKEKEKNEKGKEQDALQNLEKKNVAKAAFKKKLAENGKEKAGAVKNKLNNGDKEGAKEKAGELADETEQEFYLDFGYDLCPDWNLKLGLKYYYTPQPTPIPPEIINEFTRKNIRYKVYKDADCGDEGTPPYLTCYRWLSTDTLLPDPEIWITHEKLPRKNCERGTGFCVEQEVVLTLTKHYSDAACTRLIAVYPDKGFACFD